MVRKVVKDRNEETNYEMHERRNTKIYEKKFYLNYISFLILYRFNFYSDFNFCFVVVI